MKIINTLVTFLILLISKSIISIWFDKNYHFEVKTMCNFTNENVTLYLYDRGPREKKLLANNTGICGEKYYLNATIQYIFYYDLWVLVTHFNSTKSHESKFLVYKDCNRTSSTEYDVYYKCNETLTNSTKN
uniref:ZP domain-containing protein n=1 Tax=Strongyloides venezuelensis TaxID=75913 RepID=A0A0K0EWP0_STRVS